MKALKIRFNLFLTATLVLFSVSALAGIPGHVEARRLAPNHSIDFGAGRAELGELKNIPKPPKSPTPKAPADSNDPIRNVYFTSTPDGAISSMARRLQAKRPISLSARQFAERGISVGDDSAVAVADGKVVVRVSRELGVVEFQFANRTEELSLETIAGKPVDMVNLKKAIVKAEAAFYASTSRPDRIAQTNNGSFTVFAGDTPIELFEFDPGEADTFVPGDERVVIELFVRPSPPPAGGGHTTAKAGPVMNPL